MNAEETSNEGKKSPVSGLAAKTAIWMIRCYQAVLSPALGGHCRFYPTCSAYCIAAIEKYGFAKGILKGIIRLGKCHPFHPGGIDYA